MAVVTLQRTYLEKYMYSEMEYKLLQQLSFNLDTQIPSSQQLIHLMMAN
jgi:hypothetical protein